MTTFLDLVSPQVDLLFQVCHWHSTSMHSGVTNTLRAPSLDHWVQAERCYPELKVSYVEATQPDS